MEIATIYEIMTGYILLFNNQFINYYQNEVDKTISDKLSPFAVKGLMIQADIEIKRGKSTLIQNKKSYQDFFSSNEKFLKDNLYYLL